MKNRTPFDYRCIIWDWNGTLIDDTWMCHDLMLPLLDEYKGRRVDLEEYRDLFCQPLEEVFASVGPELRIDLPDDWILFLKLREGESRLLLAHPETSAWVSTAAFERSHGEVFLRELKALRPGTLIDVRALGDVASVSNLHLLIEGI